MFWLPIVIFLLRLEIYVPIEYYYELVDYRKEVDTLRPPRGVLLNMGTYVNSGSADYGPALNENSDLLIFTSKRNMPLGLDARGLLLPASMHMHCTF